MVDLGVMLPLAAGLSTSGDFLREFAGVVDDCGVESVWAVEHVVVAADYEPNYPYSDDGRMPSPPGSVTAMPDPLDALAFVAAASRRVKLGTCVVVAPLHSPAVLAKRAATIDNLSGGRMILGLGIGWQREEYEAVGAPFRARGARLEECMGAMRALWTESPASFAGTHWSFDRVYSKPQPERGAIPIVLGGNSAPAMDRAGRIGDGWFPFTIGPGDFAAGVTAVRSAATAAGRDPDAVEISAWPGSFDPTTERDVDVVGRYVDAGASRVLVLPQIGRADGLPAMREQLERFRDQVLARL